MRMIKQIKEIVDASDAPAWETFADYPKDGQAQIAETPYRNRPADRTPHPPAGGKRSCRRTGGTSRS